MVTFVIFEDFRFISVSERTISPYTNFTLTKNLLTTSGKG